jgi:cytochrome c556
MIRRTTVSHVRAKPWAASALLALSALTALGIATLEPWPAAGQGREPGLTGSDRADDVIMARQLLMDGIDEEMQPIDIAGAGKDTPLEELKAHASRISNMMPAFPHLFPPQTTPATSADGSASPTTATAAIWERFDDFYKLSQAAATTAYDASQAADLNEFKQHGAKLRALCDGCHAVYMKVETPPPP